jgi:hypothetical protein
MKKTILANGAIFLLIDVNIVLSNFVELENIFMGGK